MSEQQTRSTWQTPSPTAAVLPGVFGVVVGPWMLSTGAPLLLSWLVFGFGLAFLITGCVAKGVEWGLALHERNRG